MKFARLIMLAVCTLAGALAWPQGAMEINPTKGLDFQQKLGVQVPMDLPFKDEHGKDVRLGDFFKERPVVLVLVFYQCQSSCLLIRDGLLRTLNAQKSMKAGREFDVVVVSINHKETPEMALSKEESYLADYRYPETAEGWHLLTGSKSSILSLTKAVGFSFKFEEVKNEETGEMSDQISHPSGLVVLTPDGMTSLYLLGAKYPQELLRRGILDAKTNKIGPKTETILLGCFMYDPKTGKYRLVIENALKVSGIATMLILFGSIFVMSMRHRRTPLDKSGSQGGAA